MTSRVLSCPPASCLAAGCPGHELAVKGLAGCLNLAGAVGGVIELEFVVFDRAVPPNSASVKRFIALGPPCDVGLHSCEVSTGVWVGWSIGGGGCSPFPPPHTF